MATNNSGNTRFVNGTDGFTLGGGNTVRSLGITGGDMTFTGAGTATISFPSSTSTLATLALAETFTNKTLNSPVLVTPALGVASATTINKVTITAPATGSTLTLADGKTLTVNNSLTFAGTDATTQTFPTTSATIARTDAAQTFTGAQTFSTISAPTNSSVNMNAGTYNTIQTYTPAASGTATLDLSKGNVHHITMPAGNITIAISNGTAGQCFIVRILQDSVGSRTATWFTTNWAGGSAPVLTTTASKADTFGFEVTGSSTYDGFIVGQNI